MPASKAPPAADSGALEIDACRRGDRAAIERVLLAHAPDLERLLGRMVRRADVADLLHEVFVAAIEGFPRFRGEASLRTWLARIAVRVAYDHLRTPLRRAPATLRLVASDGDALAPAPDAALEDRALSERLVRHLERLSPKNRIALVLVLVEGRSIAEAAGLMQASETATKARVYLGRRALLRHIEADRALRELLTGRDILPVETP